MDQLLSRVRSVLQRCRDHETVISWKKFEINNEVQIAGYIVSHEGVRPDPEKTEAIREFPIPRTTSQVRPFVGLANSLGKYLPDLTHAMTEIRALIKANAPFYWGPDQQASFERTKKLLTSDLIVKHFDSKMTTELVTDASKLEGFGYPLL